MRVKHCSEKRFVSVLMYPARHRKASKPCLQAVWKPLYVSLEGALVSDLEQWTLRLKARRQGYFEVQGKMSFGDISGFPRASQVALVLKNPPVNAADIRDVGLIHRLGRFPGRGRPGNPLQYSYLENPTDRGAWQITVHGAQIVGCD